jgi:thiamine-phosphate pyrophosphorylase
VSVDRRARLRDARLYFVADRGGMERALEGALAGGVDLFQLRDKDATDDELLDAAAAARSLCEAAGALFLLNDRPDVAAASGADGVHVGQDDMPVDRARKLVGDDTLVGLSTHSIRQVQAGWRSGADYIAVGPVHATPTKEGRPAIGVEPIAYAAAHVTIPWFAIGGLDAGTVGAVVEAGARRIVVVRALAHADDPEATARALRAATTSRAAGGPALSSEPDPAHPGWPAEVPPRG